MILVAIMACCFISCSDNKVTMSQCLFNYADRDLYIFRQDGKPFSGVMWSEDKKTEEYIVQNSRIMAASFYDSKGRLFCVLGRIHDELKDSYYDENGLEISEDKYQKQYPDRYREFKKENSEMGQVINSHLTKDSNKNSIQ